MNTIILKGRLTKDIEIKKINNDKNVANFCVAVKRNYKNAQGEYDTDFFNCCAFGNVCELLNNYFKKGQEILLSGRLQNRQWETESGEKRYATDIVVERVEFCGSKSENNTAPKEETKEGEVPINIIDDTDSLPF